MSRVIRLLPIALLGLCLFLPSLRAEPDRAFRLEARIPATSLAIATLEDVGRWEERFDRTAIAAFFKEPELAAFVEPLQSALTQWVEGEDGPLSQIPPIAWEAIQQLSGLHGQLAIALVDLDLEQGMPALVASLDFGSHLGDFVTFIGRLRNEMDPEGEMLNAFEKAGRMWWRVTVEGAPPLVATTVGTTFVLGTDEALVERTISGEAQASLHSSADFSSTRTKVGGADLGALVYANAPALWSKFRDQVGEEAAGIVEALGLGNIRALAYGMSFKGDGFQDTFIVHAPDSKEGIFNVVPQRPFRPVALKRYVPSSAFFYEESAMEDPSQVLPAIRRLVAKIDPEAAEQMNAMLSDVSGALAVDIERELIGGLAGGYAFYAGMPETGGLYPEVAILLQVKDPSAYEETFSRFANGLAGMATEEGDILCTGGRVIEYKGRRLHLFEMQATEGDDVVPFTPTWMVSEDWLVLTLVPYTMKEIIARRAEQGNDPAGGGLASQEDFASLLAAMPAGTTHMSYLDLQAVMNLLYDTGVPLLQTAVKPNVLGDKIPFQLDWAQLPPARTVRRHFRSLGVFVTLDRNGLSLSLNAPVPMMGLIAVAVAVAVPFLMIGGRTSMRLDDGWVEVEPMPVVPGLEMSAREELAKVQAEDLARYVRAFVFNNKRLPRDLDELVSSGVAARINRDPWGGPYSLQATEDDDHRSFQIVSAGADGELDTEDDVRVDG